MEGNSIDKPITDNGLVITQLHSSHNLTQAHTSHSLTRSHSPPVLVEGVYTILIGPVPQSHCLIITARQYQSAIRGELGTTYPVTVTTQCVLVLLSVDTPQLKTEEGDGAENNNTTIQ